jgi:hypothetical protein
MILRLHEASTGLKWEATLLCLKNHSSGHNVEPDEGPPNPICEIGSHQELPLWAGCISPLWGDAWHFHWVSVISQVSLHLGTGCWECWVRHWTCFFQECKGILGHLCSLKCQTWTINCLSIHQSSSAHLAGHQEGVWCKISTSQEIQV